MGLSVVVMKIIFLIVTFVSTLGFTLIPLIVIPRGANKTLPRKSMRIVSFCNCFAGGVFLSTLLVGLIPFVREKFEETFEMKQVVIRYPVTEAMVLIGFFVNLMAEKCIVLFQKHRSKRRKSRTKTATKVTPIRKETRHYTIVTSSSEGTDDELSEHEMMNNTSLKSPAPTEKSKSNSGHRHHHHHHSHDNGSSGHGHSHNAAEIFHKNSGLRCILLLLAMSIHGVFEGLAVGLQEEMEPLVGLYIAVIVHECLVSFAMGVSIAKQKLHLKTMVMLATALCLMIPVGIGAGIMLGTVQGFGGGILNAVIQGIAAGTFLYVIFLEILPPEIEGEEDQVLKLMFLTFGALLIASLRVMII